METALAKYYKHRIAAAEALWSEGKTYWEKKDVETQSRHEHTVARSLYHKLRKDRDVLTKLPQYPKNKLLRQSVADIDKRLPGLKNGKYHHVYLHGM